MKKLNKINNTFGFTIIELLIVVAIIGILSAIMVPVFQAYRHKGLVATCFESAHSVQTSLVTYACDNLRGSFPEPQMLSDWQEMVRVCNQNGATLTDSPKQTGFKDWLNYTAVDDNADNEIEEFYLLLRVHGVPGSITGSQIEINSRSIMRQTY